MKIFVMPMANEGCSHYRINKIYKLMGDNEIIFFQDKDMETPEALSFLEECDYVLCLQYRDWETDRKSTRLNSSHSAKSRMPSSA